MAVFYNQATLTYNGRKVASNMAEGELIEELSLTKTALLPTYGIGGKITYVVSIVNNGTADYTGLTVSDDLGAYEFSGQQVTPLTYAEGSVGYYANGVPQQPPTVTEPLTFTDIAVPAGGNAMLIYEASVNEFAPPTAGSQITNTVTVSGASLTAQLTASETVTAEEAPQLSIIKSLSPEEVTAGGELTYTFDIYNYGNTAVTAADNAALTDTFAPVLKGLTATLDGTPLPASAYTYDETSGEFATTAGTVTLAAAEMAQDTATGEWKTVPSKLSLTISGTL